MKIVNNEKQKDLLESGVFVLPRKKDVMTCPEYECVCKAVQYKFKEARMLLGIVLLTTHVAALLCFLVLLEGGRVHDDKLLALQMDLAALRSQCDSSLQHLRYKLEEKSVDEKMNSANFEESDEVPSSDGLGRHDSSSENTFDSEFSNDFLSNVMNEMKKNNTEIQDINVTESFENISEDLSNNMTDDLAFQEELCSKLLSSDIQDNQENSILCGDASKRSRRTKRSNLRGPVASHFKGGIPETYIRDGGLVAPWYPDDKASASFTLNYEFREGKGTVEVTEEGLYLIYAQVYYLTTEPLNTFVVHVREKDAQPKPIAYCSSNAVIPIGGVTEVSCYTAVVHYLNATNQVYITQRDRNRRMIMRDGHSFMGLVFLNSPNFYRDPKRRRANRN